MTTPKPRPLWFHPDAPIRLAVFLLGMGMASDWGDWSSLLVCIGVAIILVESVFSRK